MNTLWLDRSPRISLEGSRIATLTDLGLYLTAAELEPRHRRNPDERENHHKEDSFMGPTSLCIWEALEFRTPTVLRIVEALPSEAWTWSPRGNPNCIAWLLWHIAEVEDNWVRRKLYELPERYPFGTSVREADEGHYPEKRALLDYFNEVRSLSKTRLAETSEAAFERRIYDEHFGEITARTVWIGVATSCNWHGGQIVYLNRLIPKEHS